MADATLFPDLVPIELPDAEPGEKLSADRRRTLRQRADVERGRHPLTGGRLSSEPDVRCGNCRFRELFGHHNRSYPKCTRADGLYLTHSAASDVRAWWPACTEHEWGASRMSPDAMRSGPSSCEVTP